jgi:hypothetical protein
METLADPARAALIGIGATAVMDAWLALLRRLRQPTLDFALLGRWTAHALRGRVMHVAIAKSPPVPGETAIGWLAHYAVGVSFAALLIAVAGLGWMHAPTLAPALAVGIATVAAPWFVMQPAMGAGIAAARTPAPLKNRVRSLANHTVFGAGMYLAAALLERIAR